MYQLHVTYADHANDRFTPLGSVNFRHKAQWRAEFDRIPTTADTTSPFVLDQIGKGGEIVADKLIDAGTAETLLGQPAAELIAEGTENLAIETTGNPPRFATAPGTTPTPASANNPSPSQQQ